MPKPTAPAHSQSEISKPQLGFDTRPDTGFIRQSHVLEVVPFSAATLWRCVKAGKFPAPVKLSERVTAWRTSDVRQWLANQAGGV
ncbi:AlpA family phage regulatory protein [bacterium]|nr:AlpA family phage regulatory protein [bacterium]